MTFSVSLTSELRHWLTHNLDRGCAPSALVESMIGQRFEPQVARGLVNAFVSARSTGMPVPTGDVVLEDVLAEFEYETPRLAAGNSISVAGQDFPVLMRLARPALAVIGGLLTDEECRQLIELARPRLMPSTVVDPQTGADTVAGYRNSEGMFFRPAEVELIARLDERLCQLVNMPAEHGEGLQVLRYGPAGHTAPHFDFLVPTNAANTASLKRSGQRACTVMVYLNDVPMGGETVFPEAGVSISPRRGNAVCFEYTNSRHQVDTRSLHAGAPVLNGEKWAVTKWIRERRFVPA